MSAADNTALVRRLLERLRDGWTVATVEEFFAPTYRRYLTATTPPITRDQQRERASRLRTAFPDAGATLEDLVAEGDRVAYRLTIRGTHRGEFLGMAPTGKFVTVTFIAIVRLADGKIVEEWGGLDQTSLVNQLRGTVGY